LVLTYKSEFFLTSKLKPSIQERLSNRGVDGSSGKLKIPALAEARGQGY
jgi:hypothetical protein